jgi:hypothetical protein
MTIISRLNTTVNNHATAANIIAAGLLASIAVVSAAAINYSGQLAKASYDYPFANISVKQTPVAKPAAKARPITQTSVMSLQAQQPSVVATLQPARISGIALSDVSTLGLQTQLSDVVTYLQPAPGVGYDSGISASALQPAANSIQLTGNGLQDAAGIR